MKKVTSILCALALSSTLLFGVACGSEPSSDATPETSSDMISSASTVSSDTVPATSSDATSSTSAATSSSTSPATSSSTSPATSSSTSTPTNTIKTITGVTFSDKKVVADGSEHTLTVSGELPDGVTVSYQNNQGTQAGTYLATATLTGEGYETLTLQATLTILDLANVAQNLLDGIMVRPNAWQYLPDAFSPSNMAYDQSPTSDFSSSVQVDQLARRPIGKQLNVLYTALTQTDTVLSAFDKVYTVGETIASAYQAFINTHPEDYKEFSGSAGGFSYRIQLNGSNSELLAGNSTVSLELSTDGAGTTYGRIQLTNGIALKYENTQDHLVLALKATVSGVGYLRKVEFVRDSNGVTGYTYEYEGTESTALQTSAIFTVDEEHVYIMSNKRETDDLPILGYEEVYNAATGEMVGGEVTESMKIGTFDTLWFPLYKVSGISSVRVTDDANGKNLNSVYLNGSSALFATKTITLTQTREYDIEMKDVWYIVKQVSEDGTISYEKEKSSVPMLFIQTKYFSNFSSDVVKQNANLFQTTPVIDSISKEVIANKFSSLYALYSDIKEAVTYQAIIEYIGDKNSYFE